jgi:hypothetical protein
MLQLLRLKARNDKLPRPNELPTSTYEAKRIIFPLRMIVQKIHAYRKHWILYSNQYVELTVHPKYKSLDSKHACEVGSVGLVP